MAAADFYPPAKIIERAIADVDEVFFFLRALTGALKS